MSIETKPLFEQWDYNRILACLNKIPLIHIRTRKRKFFQSVARIDTQFNTETTTFFFSWSSSLVPKTTANLFHVSFTWINKSNIHTCRSEKKSAFTSNFKCTQGHSLPYITRNIYWVKPPSGLRHRSGAARLPGSRVPPAERTDVRPWWLLCVSSWQLVQKSNTKRGLRNCQWCRNLNNETAYARVGLLRQKEREWEEGEREGGGGTSNTSCCCSACNSTRSWKAVITWSTWVMYLRVPIVTILIMKELTGKRLAVSWTAHCIRIA